MVINKMNDYLIEYKIKTLSELWEPFEYKGFSFKNWDFSGARGCFGDAWIVSRQIEAKNAQEAFLTFQNELNSIVERIGFISQCSTTINSQPFLILKLNSDEEKIFFFLNSKEVSPVPLHFTEEEKDALIKLEGFEKQDVFKYLNESTNTETYYTRLAMLVITLESIAGEKELTEKCKCGKERKIIVTDKDIIKTLLNDEAVFKAIFSYNGGLRNNLFHGKSITIDKDYAGVIYKKLVEHFNNQFKTKISTDVVDPQRTFGGNYMASRCFWKPRDVSAKIELKILCELPEDDFNHQFDIVVVENY
ncbi:hypothetical protein A2V71_02995 [Candidatus Berkelbacteria bacterium RBG_13_40_8]|uniref:Uncharacterized protein n=1 Tax=Candidatus Berkelbacteria bacterium RBG_13_40_8 TaxID=1797467 RepID=A0A1F5DPK1_9BACT|nr:MAG: hypothetical protein A2V71_02995 [Candidatus Berkelbacteria bacterium RBG_13_40_8]